METAKTEDFASSDKRSEPLLTKDGDNSRDDSFYGKDLTMQQSTRVVFKEFFPMYLSIALDVSSYVAVAFFVGTYSGENYYLGGVGLGTMTNNFILRSYVLGFDNSLLTLLSQAYGAKQYEYFGDTVNRARIFFTSLMLPILFILWFTEDIMIAIGQPEQVAHEAGKFVRVSSFGFLCHLNYDIYRKMLNAIRRSSAYTWFPYVTCPLSFLGCWFLIVYLDLKAVGGALVILLNPVLNMLMSMFMVHYFRIGVNCLKWPDRESFKGWWELFKLGLPTYLLQVFSFISTEAVILLTGYVSTEILVANVALINIYYMVGLFAISLQIVASALIGNKVGEGSLEGTKNMIRATTFLFLALTVLCLVVFYMLTWAFTNQEMLMIYPAVCVSLVSTSICTLLITILIGLGLQKGTMIVNLVSFLILGIPMSCYLTFYAGWIYYGPWAGLILANLFN